MIIQHMCRNCGNLERFSREQLGQKFRCPLCNTLNTVSAGSLPPRKKSSSRKPSKAKSTPPPKRFIPIAAIVAAPCALIVIVIVCVVLFRPKQQTSVNLANDSDAPDTMQDASDETADAGPNADAPENQNVDGPEDAGAAVNNPDVPNAADPNARDIAAGRNPSPPDGELELFDSIDLNELTDRNRLSVCEMVETDHVDPGGGFRNSKDVVWTNVKTYTNPGAPTDFVVTVLVSSHYQSLTPRSTVINADGSVAARHVPVDVFKGGLRSVYVGNFKSRTTNVKFRSADPERFGQFSSGLPQGTWCFFHKGSRVPRVRGSFLAGKRHGLFQCFNAAGERIWMGEYAHGERLTSTTEVDRVPGLVARHFGLTNPVGQLDFSPSGRLLVVSSDSATLGDTDRAVTLMSTDTWQPLLNLPSNGTNIPQIVFSKDENLLIAFDRRSRSSTVDAGCWKITSDSPAFKWSSYVQPRSHHFSKDGSMLLISGQLSNAAAGERFHLFSIVNTDAGTIFCNGPEWKAGGSAPTSMMFSDDGRLVLAEYGGSSVSVYQTSDGTEVSRLPFAHLVSDRPDAPIETKSGFCRFNGETSQIEVVEPAAAKPVAAGRGITQLFPEQKIALTIQQDRVTSFDLASGRQLSETAIESYIPRTAAGNLVFSPDQKFWAGSAKRDGRNQPVIRRTDTGEIVRRLSGDPRRTTFSSDSTYAICVESAAATSTTTLRMFALLSDATDASLSVPASDIVAMTPDETKVIAATRSLDLLVIDAHSPEVRHHEVVEAATIEKERVLEWKQCPDVAMRDQFVSATVVADPALTDNEYFVFRPTPDTPWMASADGQFSFRVAADAEEIELEVHVNGSPGRESPSLRRQITLEENPFQDWRELYVHQAETIQGNVPLADKSGWLPFNGGVEPAYTSVRFSPDGLSLIAFGNQPRVLRSWKLSSPGATGLIGTSLTPSSSGDFTPDGKTFCVTTESGTLQIWDVKKGRAQDVELTPRTGRSNRLCISPDGNLAAIAGEADRLYVASVKDGAVLETHTIPGTAMYVRQPAWSPDGSTIAVPHTNGVTAVNRDGTLKWKQALRTVTAIEFSDDGHLLYCLAIDDLHALNAVDGTIRHTWPVDAASAFTCLNNNFAAVSIRNGNIILISLQTGTPLKMLSGHTGTVTGIDASPDGTFVVSTGEDSTVRIWGIDDESLDLETLRTAIAK